LQLEVLSDVGLLQDGQPLELELAHPVLRTLGDGDVDDHVLRRLLLVRLAVEVGDARLPDPGRDVPVVEVEVLEPSPVAVRVVLVPAQPLLLGVGRLPAEPGQQARLLQVLEPPAQLAVGEGRVAVEGDLRDPRLGAVRDHEGQLLAGSAYALRLVLDGAERTALPGQHPTDDRLHAARLGHVIEGVDPDLRLALLELVLDAGRRQLLRAAVVDDLDALALRDAEDDDLAVGAVIGFELQVFEEARVPQPPEVLAQPPLVEGVAWLRLYVVEQRLGLQEMVPLHFQSHHGWGRLVVARRGGRARRHRQQTRDNGDRSPGCGEPRGRTRQGISDK
jgi:hypothetical protein